jgi:hypothetical protein
MKMNMNNKLLAQMRAATRSLMKKPQVDTNKVIQDALKNASALTQAAQAQMSGLSQANGMANLRSAGDVPDMLAELSRKFGHGGRQRAGGTAARHVQRRQFYQPRRHPQL